MEPMDIVGKSKEDASLPKATMTKIIKEMLPPDVRVARDTQDLLIECCVEFINLISSESNEVCNREEKRTIAPEHVLKALEVLGFGEYIEEVYAAYEQHKIETMFASTTAKNFHFLPSTNPIRWLSPPPTAAVSVLSSASWTSSILESPKFAPKPNIS